MARSCAFDDGSPSLSDTQMFNILVFGRPVLASPAISNETVTLSWSAIPGASYRLESIVDLASGVWSNVASDVTASGTNAAKSDSISTTRLYRVQVLP